AVVAPVVRCTRLEKRFAKPRQILFVNADAGVLDGQHKLAGLIGRADGYAPTSRGEFNRVGNQIDEDLADGAAVRGDVGQAVGDFDLELDARLARLERQQFAATGNG